MSFLVFIVIGLIQGITEFLPVSSSGHLVLFYQIFNITENTIFLSVFLHLATLLSIIIVYKYEIWELIKNPFCKTNKLLIVSTIPTIIIVLLLKSLIDKSFGGEYLIYGFLVTAVILGISEYLSTKREFVSQNIKYFTEIRNKQNKHNKDNSQNNNPKTRENLTEFAQETNKENTSKEEKTISITNNKIHNGDIKNISLSYKQAFAIGVAQGCAAFPAISRSGSTIATGLLVGGKKDEVTTYSFLMSIPIIIASMLYETISLERSAFVNLSAINLIASFIIAFVSGVFAIKFMIKIVKKQSLSSFSFYLIALSFVMILFKFII